MRLEDGTYQVGIQVGSTVYFSPLRSVIIVRNEGRQYGTVTRAEMTIDKENGWSKGFGFVSFATIEEAEAAMRAINGQMIAGKETKVEKTHDN